MSLGWVPCHLVLPPRGLRASAAVAALVVLVPGCTGGDDGGAESSPTTIEREAVRAEIPLGVRVHSAGFVIDAVKVQVARNPVGRHSLELVASVENVGPAPVPFEPVARLEHGGTEVDPEISEDRTGDEGDGGQDGDEGDGGAALIAPGPAAEVIIRFPLPDGVADDGAGLAAGRVLFGDPGRHRAVVPFDGSPPHTLAPIPASAGSRLVAGNLAVTVGGGHARYDDPLTHENLAAGRALLVVGFNATRGPAGAPNLARDNFRLRLPDGTVTGVRRDGRSAPNVLIAPSTTSENLTVRFEVPDPPAGEYVLIVVGPYADDGSEVRGELSFTVG